MNQDIIYVSSTLSPKVEILDPSKSKAFTNSFKGGYLNYSHLNKLKDIYITEIYMKKQYKSSIIKNHKIIRNKKLMVFP